MVYLIGLYLVSEGWVTRTARMAREARSNAAARLGPIRSRIGQLVKKAWENRPKRQPDEEEEVGPLLDEESMAAWLADDLSWREITDPKIPKIKDGDPPPPKKAPGPREESTRAIAWADGPTRALPVWELQLATPTALVTRKATPRDEYVTHYDNNGSRRSYLGPDYTPNYKPQHAAPDGGESHGPSKTRPPRRVHRSRRTVTRR